MSTFLRNILRAPAFKSGILNHSKPSHSLTGQAARSMWYMSANQQISRLENTKCCSGIAGIHTQSCIFQSTGKASESSLTQGEKELSAFLIEEIAAENKLVKTKITPTEIDGFKIQIDGSEIVMTKLLGDETIEVKFNVNHTVDADTEPEVDPSMDKPDFGEMRSKPTFEVEITRANKTLGFTCSMISPQSQQSAEEGYNDIFSIDDLVFYEGEWDTKNYSVSGDVLDGTLYDLLMNLLEDKGISNEFVEKISDFSTHYEHKCYITMLENIQKFSSGK